MTVNLSGRAAHEEAVGLLRRGYRHLRGSYRRLERQQLPQIPPHALVRPRATSRRVRLVLARTAGTTPARTADTTEMVTANVSARTSSVASRRPGMVAGPWVVM